MFTENHFEVLRNVRHEKKSVLYFVVGISFIFGRLQMCVAMECRDSSLFILGVSI